jgi:hypothetical protein
MLQLRCRQNEIDVCIGGGIRYWRFAYLEWTQCIADQNNVAGMEKTSATELKNSIMKFLRVNPLFMGGCKCRVSDIGMNYVVKKIQLIDAPWCNSVFPFSIHGN